MSDPIDSIEHAELIRLQQAADAAFAELAAHAPGVRGMDLTEDQREEAARLRAAAVDATAAVRDALSASGLVEAHGHYLPRQKLREAARQSLAGAHA